MPARALHCTRCNAALRPGFGGRLRCPLFSACGMFSPYEVRHRRQWRSMVPAQAERSPPRASASAA